MWVYMKWDNSKLELKNYRPDIEVLLSEEYSDYKKLRYVYFVGFNIGFGGFHIIKAFEEEQHAREEVHYLNGGAKNK